MAQAGHKDDHLPGQAQQSSAIGKTNNMSDADQGASQGDSTQQAGEWPLLLVGEVQSIPHGIEASIRLALNRRFAA